MASDCALRRSCVGSSEFTGDKGSRSLAKIHCSLLAERVSSTEVMKFILLDHCPDFPGLIVWSVSIREPLFKGWGELVGVDLLYFQAASREERQELADGKGTCM